MVTHQIKNSYKNNYNAIIYTDNDFGAHFHKNYELIYNLSGSITVNINEDSHQLEEGELLLISPYTIHSFSVKHGSQIWIGVFAEDYIKSFAKKHNRLQYSKFRCDKKIEEFLKEYLFYPGQPELHILKGCLYIMCNECLKNASTAIKTANSDFKGAVIDFVADNMFDDLTLAKAAAALGYEYHYFSTLFNRCFGMSFKDFVNILKFEYADELLSDTDKTIAQIAGECGFQSIRNFNRVFKKLSGKTPGEYRKEIL